MAPVLPSGLTDSWGWALAMVLLKSTLVLGAAALAARRLRNGSAARRHLAWTLSLGALLVLPLLALALPAWKLPFLQIQTRAHAPVLAAAPRSSAPVAPVGMPAGAILWMVWATGAAAVLGRMAAGWYGVRRMARGATPVTDGAWLDAVRMLAPAAGVRGPVRLLRGGSAAMPATWGVIRPTILLPAEADAWAPERRRVVLLHELAHVARRDCLTQSVATVCCAAYWFHPGAWWAAARMRVEREEACDDRVLAAGARASDYAGHLVAVARSFRVPRAAEPVMAMARGSHLADRVLAVLDSHRDRRAVGLRAGVACAVAVAAVLLPLAVVGPSERVRETPALPRVAALPPERGGRRIELDGMRMEVRVTPPPVVASSPAPPKPLPVVAAVEKPARHRQSQHARALAALIRATSDPEVEVRRSAIRALGRIRDDAVVTPLVRSLRDRDSDVRSLAARMLGELAAGNEEAAPLREVVVAQADTPRGRLGEAAADRAAEALRGSLTDEDPRVRDTALWALGEIADEAEPGGVPLSQGTQGVESTLEGGPGV
ncbi:MAG TPA: M56 family metallopeptidase [Longimicrobium sp.]|jgi:beta-lactamase regulating signal transducer with metallopeptidase domain